MASVAVITPSKKHFDFFTQAISGGSIVYIHISKLSDTRGLAFSGYTTLKDSLDMCDIKDIIKSLEIRMRR